MTGRRGDVAEFAPEHRDGLLVGQMLEHPFYMPQIACNLQLGLRLRLRLRLQLLDDQFGGGANGRIEVILKHAGKDATTKSTRPLS